MKNSVIRKKLVCLVIILFIGIAVAPSVTSIEFTKDKTSNDSGLIEITLQLFKTDGVEDHKMFITQEQDEQLDLLIQNFKKDLDKAETREETIEIYKDMVESLDEIGILPESINCKEVKELVTGENSIGNSEKMKSMKHFNHVYEKLKNKNPKQSDLENNLCLIAGETTNTRTVGLGTISLGIHTLFVLLRTWFFIYTILFYILYKFIIEVPNFIIHFFNNRILFWGFVTDFSLLFPLKFGGYMAFGWKEWNEWEQMYFYYPAEGWVYTNGLNGIKSWIDDSFYGRISTFELVDEYYLGATGFTGIKTSLHSGFYFGSALQVKLSFDKPT